MPSRGPALTFDPRYVTATMDVWRTRHLMPISQTDLEREATRVLLERFVAWNIMGMYEQSVSASSVTKALAVLTALKLAKKTTKGKGEARVVTLTTTTSGRAVLQEEPVAGTLYPYFAECLSAASKDISSLLDLLAQFGPLTQPVLHPLPEAPRRGAAYQAAVKDGLRDYQHQSASVITAPRVAYEPANLKATPVQRIKAAQTWAAHAHPAGTIRQLEKAVAISLAFGLLWVDVIQVNDAIGAKSVGLAATKTAGGYRPNFLRWPNDSSIFVPALISAITTRDNGSGFATIQEVRGALGRTLHLSPAAVDALLREARDAGDRREIPIELHFEPDEDQLYASHRDPLIWRTGAFEFISVSVRSRV